ncbi:YgfZ/GcvT domain-containing protein [Nakamurella deserti]|uniref:CAF17-like 4Fe-4S cluster assembly/insertion protein YgfZ n=1 Tax=Nakamurella deserti TaxID=2164074 RepID=UPI000DBE508D|nr:folate-binding protein YgfZ [Nakamurella deserti]
MDETPGPLPLLHPAHSPLLQRPGAVAGSGADATVAWHYGDPMGEQRRTERGTGLVDRSHREVLKVAGTDRHDWLNKLTSQLLLPLADGAATEALVLSPQGHVEHHFGVTEFGDAVYLDTEPGRGTALLDYLERMKFWSRVDLSVAPLRQLSLLGRGAAQLIDGTPAVGRAVAHGDGFVRRSRLGVDVFTLDVAGTATTLIAAGAAPTGSWADDALRVPTRRPRIGVDTDDRTIPNEVSWLTDAVHLHKGCYRGQETVARVANLGRPPRRLVMLNLDGSQDLLPAPGDPVTTAEGRTVGRLGTVAQHHEDGPIALALVKRAVGPDAALLAGGVDARIDPADGVPDDASPMSRLDRGAFVDLRRN